MAEPQEEELTSTNPEPAGNVVRQPADDQQPAASAPPPPPAPRPAAAPPKPPPGETEPHKPGTDDLAAHIEQAWADLPHEAKFNFGDVEISLDKQHVPEACTRAKADGFDYFMCLTGTDYETHLELIYHLYSYRDHRRLTLRTKLDTEGASIASVTPIWKGSDWHERETAEMLGMVFEGHPDLRKLLLDDDVDETPLRKSHPLVAVYEDRPGIVRRPVDSPA